MKYYFTQTHIHTYILLYIRIYAHLQVKRVLLFLLRNFTTSLLLLLLLVYIDFWNTIRLYSVSSGPSYAEKENVA